MGSSSIDKKTQQSSSTGAQGAAGTLTNNGQQLTGAGQGYQKGVSTAISPFLNPSSLNVSSPTGSYGVQYQDQKNANAQAANQAIQSTNRNLASRGMGTTPAGFAAANNITAYQNQANANQQAYQNAVTQQQQNATNNFWNAVNTQNQMGTTDIGAGNTATQGAGSIYDSLYGTSSQQKQSPWGTILGGVAGLGSATGSIISGVNK